MVKKIILLLGLTFGYLTSFGQQFSYTFRVEEVTTAAEAKDNMDIIRDVMGVETIRFDDEFDRFNVVTFLDFDPEETRLKLMANGILVDGVITKINIE